MKHSELLLAINRGIVVSRFKIKSLGTQEEDVERQKLLASFTGVIKYEGKQFGVLPMIDQRENHFDLFWQITAVEKVEDKWIRKDYPTSAFQQLIQSAVAADSDMRQFLNNYEFEAYDGN